MMNGLPAGGDAGLVDVDDVRVPGQPGHRLLLTQESLAIFVFGEFVEKQFHGDRAAESTLDAAVNDAEPTLTDRLSVAETGRLEVGYHPERSRRAGLLRRAPSTLLAFGACRSLPAIRFSRR